MVLAHEDEKENPHPYWYARVIGIFHVFVQCTDPTARMAKPQRMEALWVRWFGRDLDLKSGWAVKCLCQVGFYNSRHPDAFGFLDPCEVIRAAHLIPRFAYGRTSILLGPSDVRNSIEDNEDWIYYSVNM